MKVKNKKIGFTINELMICISIIAILSIAAFVIYTKVSSKYLVNNEVSHLQLLKKTLDDVQDLNKVTFSNSFNKSISLSDNKNGDILDQWKGIVSLSKVNNDDYSIGYSNLSRFNCAGLAHDGLSIFKYVTINDSTFSRSTISTASSLCKKNGNTLVFGNENKENSATTVASEEKTDDSNETTENSDDQKELLNNAPWGYEAIQQSSSGYLSNGDYAVSFNETSIGGTSSVVSTDALFSKLIKNYIDSNKGTISNGDLENYIYSIGDGYSDQIDGKSISFNNTDVPKALCNNGGYSCHITKNSDGTYTTIVTFSKKQKYSY